MLIRIFIALLFVASILLRFVVMFAPFICLGFKDTRQFALIQEHLVSALDVFNFQGVSYADSIKEHFATGFDAFIKNKHATIWAMVWTFISPFFLFYPEFRNEFRGTAYGSSQYYAGESYDDYIQRRNQEEEEEEARERRFAHMTPGTPEYLVFHVDDRH